MLGAGGAAVGGGLVGSAVESAATSASRQTVREDGMYAAGPRGQQNVVWSADTTRRVVALTFDDGPTPVFTPRVLEVLAGAGVPATFFMIGTLVREYPSIARQVAAAGHEIGNHTWSHLSAPTVSDRTNVGEIDQATDLITKVTGTAPRWYRPPRGMLVGSAVRRAFERGQGVAMWSVTRGSAADTDMAGVRRHLVESVHPGAVVDLHDGVGSSAFGGVDGYNASLTRRRQAEIDALPDVLAAWKSAGYSLVTLSDLTAV
jgi:peptidoglycan/xylan/chitin deacetylase (PgdA/CDA1 family)